jgi:putative ABC transport system permease protein
VRAASRLFRLVNLRHLTGSPRRALLAAAGIAAGVALVVCVGTIGSTLDQALTASERDVTGAADVEVLGVDETGLPQRLVPEIERVPGVVRAAPIVRGRAELGGPRGTKRALILGIDRRRTFSLARGEGGGEPIQVRSGTSDPRGAGLLLSDDLARELGVPVGGRLRVATPAGRTSISGAGRVSGGRIGELSDAGVAFVRLQVAQALLGRPGRVDAVYLTVEPGRERAVARAVEGRLAGRAFAGPPGELSRGYERAFGPLATLATLAAVAALFAAAFLVYNTLSMTVAERRRELATMRALGGSRRDLMRAFLAEAALLGTLGSLAGVATGLAAAYALVGSVAASYSFLPLTDVSGLVVEPLWVVAGPAAGFAAALLGAVLPARRIVRIPPAGALRPEAAYEWREVAPDAPARARLSIAIGAVAAAGGGVSLVAAARTPSSEALSALTLGLWLVVTIVALPPLTTLAVRIARPVAGRVFGTIGRLGCDALLRNPGRTAMTVGAVSIAAGIVIASGAAYDSYRTEFVRVVEERNGAPVYVTRGDEQATGLDAPLPADLRARIEGLPGIRAAYAEHAFLGRARGEPAVILATEVARAAREGTTRRLVYVGRGQDEFVAGLGRGEVGISAFTAKELGVGVGDGLPIATPRGERRLRVAAVWRDVGALNAVYVEHATYARLWGEAAASRLALVPAAGVPPARAAEEVDRALESWGVPAEARTHEEQRRDALAWVDGLFGLARAIQLGTMLVAAFAVANTMFIAVLEQAWSFALQRTLGATRAQLAASIAVESGSVGLIGGLGGVVFGVPAGIAMTEAMSSGYAWDVDFELPVGLVLTLVPLSAAVAVAAGLIASRGALRAGIAAAMRGDPSPRPARARRLAIRA